MKKIVETILPAGDILEIKKLEDGTYKILQSVAAVSEKDFILIEAEKLSLDDEFMQYDPETYAEKTLKDLIHQAILRKTKNFYCPKYAPTFTKSFESVCYAPGKVPAMGKNYKWWLEVAKKYNPKCNSRLGTRLEYGALLGVFIKKLIAEGNSIEWAWNAVCNDSKELGDYCNQESIKRRYELTGSKEVCGFCDLANASKFLADSEDGRLYWVAGGFRQTDGLRYPISALRYSLIGSQSFYDGYGWIVIDEVESES